MCVGGSLPGVQGRSFSLPAWLQRDNMATGTRLNVEKNCVRLFAVPFLLVSATESYTLAF